MWEGAATGAGNLGAAGVRREGLEQETETRSRSSWREQVAGRASTEDQDKWGRPQPSIHTPDSGLAWDQAVSVLVGHCLMGFR